MDKRPKKELINCIKDFLNDFEEPYDHKEWEQFQLHRKKRQRKPIPLFIKLAGVAASLFLMVYASVRIFPLLDRMDEKGKNDRMDTRMPIPEVKEDSLTVDTAMMDSISHRIEPGYEDRSYEGPAEPVISFRTQGPASKELPKPPKSVMPARVVSLTANSVPSPTPDTGPSLLSAKLLKGLERPRKFSQFDVRTPMRLELPTLRSIFRGNTNFKSINAGFHVNPAFTDKGFAFGGGISAEFPFSRRISAEIGLDYSHIKVGMDRKADVTDTVSSQLVGIRSSVGMVVVPLTVNYQITENFTAGLGLVPFRVVRDRRTDILETYRWIASDLMTEDTTRRFVSERTSQSRPDSIYMGKSYLGFIQVSGRYSPSFLRKYNSVIAPFISIPIGRLRNEPYRWLHGGVSLRVYLR